MYPIGRTIATPLPCILRLMGYIRHMEARSHRLQAAASRRHHQDQGPEIREVLAGKYLVPSQSHGGSYLVDIEAKTCTCPDAADGHRCKHQLVVAYVRHELMLPMGTRS